MKIAPPQILHKTEAGGVIAGATAAAAKDAYAAIVGNAGKYDAKAEILGVQVQQMLPAAKRSSSGRSWTPPSQTGRLGLGGILVEVLKDITSPAGPATHEDALSMLDGIAAAEILRGVQWRQARAPGGARGHDREKPALVADFPEIAEMDLNPVFAAGRPAPRRRAHRARFRPRPARDRPSRADIVEKMTRIMKPKALAVIGASVSRTAKSATP